MASHSNAGLYDPLTKVHVFKHNRCNSVFVTTPPPPPPNKRTENEQQPQSQGQIKLPNDYEPALPSYRLPKFLLFANGTHLHFRRSTETIGRIMQAPTAPLGTTTTKRLRRTTSLDLHSAGSSTGATSSRISGWYSCHKESCTEVRTVSTPILVTISGRPRHEGR